MNLQQETSLQSALKQNAQCLKTARRVVIKIGSALLVEEASGTIRHSWLESVAEDIAMLRQRSIDVIVVSSGAIATGRRHLGLIGRSLKLDEKQAAAASGQILLAHAWQTALARHAISLGQVLVTPEDTENRKRHLNARATINTLLRLGVVPLINENDTVATEEIRYGDNDRLAARVSQMVSADTLVLLSDIDGLYTADPRKNADARFIETVSEVTPEIEAMADAPPPGFSSGGMITKIMAARIAMSAGCRMCISLGRTQRPLSQLMTPINEGGAKCTWFMPQRTPLTARKKWIAGHLEICGIVHVDQGALLALQRGKSLLPAGVIKIEGQFDRGDVILVKSHEGKEIARGLSAYTSEEANKIKGHQSGELDRILGDLGGRDVLIHRDDLVVFQNKAASPEESKEQ